MSQPTTANRTRRIAAYTALAGAALPASAANAELMGESELNIPVFPGAPVAVDFGPGYGEIFQFAFNLNMVGRAIADSSQIIQFAPGNSGSWTAASFVPFLQVQRGHDDPKRLSTNYAIDANASWYAMSSALGTAHDLASHKTDGNSSGDWAPDLRGFVGLRFSKTTTNRIDADYTYAWIDVSASLTPNRTFAGFEIHGWGLQTTPNRGLPAGVPAPGAAGLALLAMGAAGIRRQRRHTA